MGIWRSLARNLEQGRGNAKRLACIRYVFYLHIRIISLGDKPCRSSFFVQACTSLSLIVTRNVIKLRCSPCPRLCWRDVVLDRHCLPCSPPPPSLQTPYRGWSNQKVWVEVAAGYRMPRPPVCTPAVYEVWRVSCVHLAPLRLISLALPAFVRAAAVLTSWHARKCWFRCGRCVLACSEVLVPLWPLGMLALIIPLWPFWFASAAWTFMNPLIWLAMTAPRLVWLPRAGFCFHFSVPAVACLG